MSMFVEIIKVTGIITAVFVTAAVVGGVFGPLGLIVLAATAIVVALR